MARKTQKRRKTAQRRRRTAARKRADEKRREDRQAIPTEHSEVAAPDESILAATGGQSGDNEDLSKIEDADSQSVEDLAETGQDLEADIVEGVERASTISGKRERRGMKVRRTIDRPPKKRNTL